VPVVLDTHILWELLNASVYTVALYTLYRYSTVLYCTRYHPAKVIIYLHSIILKFIKLKRLMTSTTFW
jgi:hypothetical protein